MKPVTICVLTFGDNFGLIQRCLGSVENALTSTKVVKEIRICLNACTPRVLAWVQEWSLQVARMHRVSSTHYVTEANQFKYPLMRAMIRAPKPIQTSYMMWFDDDSYLDPIGKQWWQDMLAAAASHDMIGQLWRMPIQGNQWAWIQSQPWYNPKVGMPRSLKQTHAFDFCQGAWWVTRPEILLRHDWPVAEIRHNGGDSMLGELWRHQGLSMGRFYGGVHINADGQGRHSKSARRGHSENRVGWNYAGVPLERIAHHQFTVRVRRVIADTEQT